MKTREKQRGKESSVLSAAEPPTLREFEWRAVADLPEPFTRQPHAFKVDGGENEAFPYFGHPLNPGTWDRIVRLGTQPAVYVWFDFSLNDAVLYVGQTLHLERRTREHLNRIDRGTIGRWVQLRRERHDLAIPVGIAWRLYPCDCALDFEEARLIGRLAPAFNLSPGNLGRGPECDLYCLVNRRRGG